METVGLSERMAAEMPLHLGTGRPEIDQLMQSLNGQRTPFGAGKDVILRIRLCSTSPLCERAPDIVLDRICRHFPVFDSVISNLSVIEPPVSAITSFQRNASRSLPRRPV